MTKSTFQHEFEGTAEQFWEQLYEKRKQTSNGAPSEALARFAPGEPVGKALELGCALGDDAIWLAKEGWNVVAVDISQTALARARKNAEKAGVSDKIEFRQLDLTNSFPQGKFDLITAFFLHSPVNFPRAQVLMAAAGAVKANGLLLIAEHASTAPWSFARKDTNFPTPQQTLDTLELDPPQWRTEFLGTPERMATGPNQEKATVKDNILALRRVGPI